MSRNGQQEQDPHHGMVRSSTDLSQLRRRQTRVGTLRTIEDYDDFQVRPGWRPGAEPGLDTSKPDGGRASMNMLHAECQITIVDFSQDDMIVHEMYNDGLISFLEKPQPDWVKCRWINVNGLSWDVVQALGQHKQLHRLAIEDLMNTDSRTKADWYPNHAFFVLALQKLAHIDDTNEDSVSYKSSKGIFGNTGSLFSREPDASTPEHLAENGVTSIATATSRTPIFQNRRGDVPRASSGRTPRTLRTLHRYRASPNAARTEFMERHSVLTSKGLAVVAEQVSIFITSDNTVIAFFENSADDVEVPILIRLNSPSTLLRRSCDASMICQAIIDAIIDMAIPVQAAYADVIGDIELEVLTRPSIQQSQALYMVMSEINKMRSIIQPMTNVINAMRDHKPALQGGAADSYGERTQKDPRGPVQTVTISPMTYTYLGDVLDHCALINDNLWQLTKAADDMIDLIFNTITAYQNESLRQLTIATIIFLPMTFLTGYFGQNFEPFPQLDEGVTLFWKIAVPVVAGISVFFMWDTITGYVKSLFRRRHILSLRKRRMTLRNRKRD